MTYRWREQPGMGAGFRTDSGRAVPAAGWALVAIAVAMMVGACASTRDGEDIARGPGRADVLEARLGAIGGSAAKGTVRFASGANGLAASVYFFGVNAGMYRMVVHTTGNCTSTNGFSAGPPWVPPGATEPPTIEFRVDNDNPASLAQRLAGLTLTGPAGVAGRSVVIHAGRTGTLEAEPGRPNSRVACAVIGPPVRLFDLF